MSDPTAPTTLAVYQADLTPLRGRWGQAWARSLGASKDTTVERARQAVLAGAVSRAPADALPYLADDAGFLVRLPTETDDEHRTRISQAWDVWPWAGTETGLAVVARQLGAPDPVVFFTGHDWPRGTTLWARWWLLVPPLATPYTPDGAWGAAGTWGDGGTWGSDATLAEVERCRRSLRQMSNARDVGHIRFAFGTTDYWGDGGVWNGAGTDDWGAADPAFLEWRI